MHRRSHLDGHGGSIEPDELSRRRGPSNPDTLDGLHSYLANAGMTAHTLRDLDDFSRRADTSIDALVLFPDDFRWESVIAAIAELAKRHPGALPVLVTARPQRFIEREGGAFQHPHASLR